MLISQIQGYLEKNTVLSVEIRGFSDVITLYDEFKLSPGSNLPQITNLNTGGGTDLTLIAGRFQLQSNERKVIVAFTDGQHQASTDLKASYAELTNLRDTGLFAQSYLTFVGNGNIPDYFHRISEIFSGSVDHSLNINDFISSVAQKIPDILRTKRSLVLTLNGGSVTKWQATDAVGIFSLNENLKEGDSILVNGFKYIIKRFTPSISTQNTHSKNRTWKKYFSQFIPGWNAAEL